MIGPVAMLALLDLSIFAPDRPGGEAGILPELLLAAMLIAVLLLLLRRSRRRRQDSAPPRTGRKTLRPGPRANWILVDGSNVMHWEDNTPHIEPVRRVVDALKAQGLVPGVVFDANAGWKLFGRYLGEREMGQLLNLPADQVLVVPKGSPADPWLLTTARESGARIVTNDRYRGWAEAHPEVARPGFLVRGGLTAGSVWLEGLPAGTSARGTAFAGDHSA